MAATIELALIEKTGGPLTKRISLDDGGRLKSDGSACVMTRGRASRLKLRGIGEFAEAIQRFEPRHAITLGGLRPGLPDDVVVLVKSKANGADNIVARTAENFRYRPGEPALVLLDYDTKGMPPEVAERLRAAGGLEAAIATVLPQLPSIARLTRASTSAGLFRTDTGEKLPAAGGLHLYLHIRDGGDAERFLKTLHTRLWLAGYGWLMIGAGGQLLERSVVDRVVGSPERLVFEGPPILVPPVAQDAIARQPVAIDGDTLDTVTACRPLTIIERSDYQNAKAKLANLLAPEQGKARAKFLAEQSERIAKSQGISALRARRVVERQCAGVLLPNFQPEFDDPDLRGVTVADILADPDKYVGETLADPLEGVEYGRGKAMIMRRADGSLWIHSFAHGRTIYELKYDYHAVEAALKAAVPDDISDLYIQLAIAADLTQAEIERLRDMVNQRSGIGKRALDAMLKAARSAAAEKASAQKREQKMAARRDPRPAVPTPLPDAEWLPIMEVLNSVHGKSTAAEPPMRTRNGDLAGIKTECVLSLHMLTGAEANSTSSKHQLPAPPQMVIATLGEAEAAEMIERHVEFIAETKEGIRPVHLAPPFVRHFLNRSDRALPVVNGTSSLPIVLGNGDILTGQGLDRKHGIVFRVPQELELPPPADCTPLDTGHAMQFLCEQWLCDVAADYAGKAVIIACALTVIERMALPERPAFFITAGQRGGGKTTVLHMISAAVLGTRAAAAAWSAHDEERRKALFAYLGAGLPLLVWDNVPLGAAISCASIEKALTAETYSDRVLGESRHLEVPAYTVQVFTGNNITAKGDLASRALCARLTVDRPDPENRNFKHADAIEWTSQNRGKILNALYTILLGNPRFDSINPKPAETRFKAWWHLVGAAVEHASEQHFKIDSAAASEVCFRKLFLDGEVDDEQASNLATVLDVLRTNFSRNGFHASEVAFYAGAADYKSIGFKAALELASGKSLPIISAPTVSARLRAIKDRPTQVDQKLLVLRYASGHRDGGTFTVSDLSEKPP
jgi:uncharacterized tellurite resistance protein B-like protein